jgi:hypothetical protein
MAADAVTQRTTRMMTRLRRCLDVRCWSALELCILLEEVRSDDAMEMG